MSTETEKPVQKQEQVTDEPDIEEKIIKQIEFYFSDSNLPNDRFLKAELEKNNGWIKVATIASFQRLKLLTTDIEQITRLVKASTELELSEDNTLMRRTKEIAQVDLGPKTAFMSGFPTTYTQEQVEQKLSKDFNIQFKCVRLRFQRGNGTRTFKGSVFIELGSEQEVEELCKREIDGFKEGEKMIIKPFTVFDMEGKAKDAERQVQKQKEEQARLLKEAEIEQQLAKFKPTPFEANHLIAVANMPAGSARETILGLTTPLNYEVAFIDFDRNRPTGAIKFVSTDIQTICAKLNEQAKTIDEANPPVFTVLTDDAETNEWDIIERLKEERLMAAKSGNKGGNNNKRKFGGKKHFSNKKGRR